MGWKDTLDSFTQLAQQFHSALHSELSLSEFQANSTSVIEKAQALCLELEEQEWKSAAAAEKETLECLIYRWSIDVLDVCILFRDASLKSSKEQILALNKNGDSTKEATVSKGVRSICQQAIQQNIQLIEETKSLQSGVDPQWFHQKEPTLEVANQLKELSAQLASIHAAHNRLHHIVPKFNEFRAYLIGYSDLRMSKLDLVREQMKESLASIASIPVQEITDEGVEAVVKSLTFRSDQIENAKIETEVFEPFKGEKEKLTLPIFADGGELIYKEIALDKRIESWTEDHLFPKLYDADLDIKSIYDTSIITLFNTRNKLHSLVINDSLSSFNAEQITKNIKAQIEKIEHYEKQLADEVKGINAKINEQFQIDKLYDLNSQFLPELNFTNISRFASQNWYKNSIFKTWVDRSKAYVKKVSSPYLKGFKQDIFGFIDERTIESHDVDSNSLFLKKGYLGRSFYIRRPSKENQIIESIQRWRKGFQGSMLVLGREGSGKSSVLEFIPQFIENFPVVQLGINKVIKLNGRKHQCTHKLGDTLSFLSTQSINKPVVVCIDDLEVWQTDDYTMYDVVRDLTDGINRYGKRLFFLVSTNHFMHDYINRLFDFDSRFAEIISMDGIPRQTIVDALLVRHNASLRDLDGEEDVSFAQRASQIANRSKNNIGVSMLAWERYIEKNVKTSPPPISFTRVVMEHQLILKVILSHGQIKESVLRKSLTSSDNYFISEEIRKLRGYKILDRTYDGYLTINPFIIDEVENTLLKEKL